MKIKGERESYTQQNSEFQRIARRDKKAFLNEQCKEIEENIKGKFHPKLGTIKDRNGKDLIEAEEIKMRWKEYREEM